MLNLPLPVILQLKKAKNVLVLGVGGFDIFNCLPVYFSLEKVGVKAHLSSFPQAHWDNMGNFAELIPMSYGCVGVGGNTLQVSDNFPEAYLASWFRETKQLDIKIWALKKDQSIEECSKSFEVLTKHLGIDAIVIVDSGIDSMMTGNEDKEVLTKSFIGSSLVLKSVENLGIDLISVCYNNGDKNYKIINKTLYNLSTQGGFYGGCFILNYMKSYEEFRLFYDYYISNGFEIPESIKLLKNNVDFNHEEHADNKSQTQLLFFNSLALIYNNNAIKNLMGDESYYDAIQKVAPYVNKY